MTVSDEDVIAGTALVTPKPPNLAKLLLRELGCMSDEQCMQRNGDAAKCPECKDRAESALSRLAADGWRFVPPVAGTVT